MIKRSRIFFIIILLFALTVLLISTSTAKPLLTIDDDTTIIYLRRFPESRCGEDGFVTMDYFIKHTLPNEWISEWQTTDGTPESLRAGAIAIRSNVLSAYHFDDYWIGSRWYRCVHAWEEVQNYQPDAPTYPNTDNAVDDTNGMYITHSDVVQYEADHNRVSSLRTGAIFARYLDEAGNPTLNGSDDPNAITASYLISVFNPISNRGSRGAGMGQYESRYLARGKDVNSNPFPPWDAARILAHFYSKSNFVGLNPTPPNDYRFNVEPGYRTQKMVKTE